MPLADALQLASRRSARPVAAVWSARFVSALQLAHRVSEDPALAGSRGFAPHWRIQFAGQEALVDEGHGPNHHFLLGDDDDVLVFADGSVLTFFELTDGG